MPAEIAKESQPPIKKRVAVSIRKGRLCFVRIPVPEKRSAVLDELPAEAALDTEVPPGDVVIEG